MGATVAATAGRTGLEYALRSVNGFCRATGTFDAGAARITVQATRYAFGMIGVTVYRNLHLWERFAAATPYEVHETLELLPSVGRDIAASVEWKLQEED